MKKIIFFALLLLSLSSKAQVIIGMSQVPPSIAQDTILDGQTRTYSVWVKNLSSTGTAFNDYITLITAVRDSTVVGDYDTVNLHTSFIPITINSNDSAMLTVTETLSVSTNGYRYGIDVIVVWPVAASAQTTDSLEYWIYIVEEASVGELDIHQLMKVYPNPATTIINLENNAVESVRIYDISGKLILTRRKESCINVEELPPGMYQLDIELSDQKHYSGKFLKK